MRSTCIFCDDSQVDRLELLAMWALQLNPGTRTRAGVFSWVSA